MLAANATLYVAGASGADTIVGSAGRDYISGGAGDDRIIGGLGSDVLTGGAGADTFVFNSATESPLDGADQITDFETGTDKLDFTGLGTGGEIAFDLSNTGETTVYFRGASGPQGAVTVYGTTVKVSDLLLAPNTTLYVAGTSGADTIVGSAGVDFISGGAGDDRITGGLGGDVLTGGAGADTFVYNSAADSPFGDSDQITDFLTGTDKLDFSGLGAGAVVAIDLSYTRMSTVYYQGSTGPQAGITVYGTEVQASDLVLGANATVYVAGTSGADTIYAGRGQDVLTGGAGADTFVFRSVSDSPTGAADLITDFNPNQDFINLSGIDADSGTTGQQSFTLTPVFTHLAGQLVATDMGSNLWRLDGDVNGDGVADFTLQVQTTATWNPYVDSSHLLL